ncbi:hypothetical protein GCM10007913_12120 [Devosia yakushimensis]|uniref:Uncharacterized protein n=1 Tax=Devosia yakushimensis TaxID=470028 RepID=A0ABQ5UDK1_9HYPH|nr:hypothetical protein [Devosia yakushimensis]GLQ09280.1 hypothetical protein GCM10007913_12120 [Devosia yakushimensis]
MTSADEARVRREEFMRSYMESSQRMHEAMRNVYSHAASARQQGKTHELANPPPLHGAIDFTRGADGTWRIPTTWTDGDAIYFGFDWSRPDSDQAAFWSFSR